MSQIQHIRVGILEEVDTERLRQDHKWGEQNHGLPVWQLVLSEEVGEFAEAILKMRGEGRTMTIADVRKEIIQVAAVAVSIAEFIDRHPGYTELAE